MSTATNTVSRFPRIERLTLLGGAVSFIVLVLTGIVVSLLGQPLTGYILLLHTGMGGLYAVCLMAFAILRSEGVSRSPEQQVSFWLLQLSGLVLIGTAAVMMLPLLGTEGQHLLVTIHRYAAWVALLAGLRYGWLERANAKAR